MTIHTKNLVLKPTGEEHIAFIQRYYNDEDILKFMTLPVPYPYPEDGAERFVKDYVLPEAEVGTHYNYMIYQNGEPIGSIASKQESEPDTWQRGFWIAKPFRGQRKGIMKEASWALMRHVFATREHVWRIISENAPSNGASSHISHKQGFIPNGYYPQDPPYHNGENTLLRWTMTRKNFELLD